MVRTRRKAVWCCLSLADRIKRAVRRPNRTVPFVAWKGTPRAQTPKGKGKENPHVHHLVCTFEICSSPFSSCCTQLLSWTRCTAEGSWAAAPLAEEEMNPGVLETPQAADSSCLGCLLLLSTEQLLCSRRCPVSRAFGTVYKAFDAATGRAVSANSPRRFCSS